MRAEWQQGRIRQNVPMSRRLVPGVRYREFFSFRNYIGAAEIGEDDRDKVRIIGTIFQSSLSSIK
ncbi:hypothetical protein L8S61_16470 [Enterobacter roggenkampii]|uniref:hypothetical protein n=1 Tax=Enterobacter cloacae complex TaxID=354276 RepID=UPI002004D3D0|nr:hypothetical protein [Enterobacter asburiae]MCK6788608.1 hypothetical protein [Enterobacter roggenkampii]MCK7358765.1 hypothetical protein [Enterobacter roggenkampii]MCM7836255.1 hypothetical protein [Enterobacter asburiae]